VEVVKVHDAAPSDAVLSTQPGRVEVKVHDAAPSDAVLSTQPGRVEVVKVHDAAPVMQF